MTSNEKKKLKVLQNTTCFEFQSEHGINCERQHCKNWIKNGDSHNCLILAVQQGPHTLQKIGQIYGLTRMRICQIEKDIFDKIKKSSF